MDRRCAELSEISSYIRNIDNEVTLILQSFQWDRNHLLESPSLALCKYDHNHRVPPDKLRLHEDGCRLKSLGYSADELLLPDPLDVNANTLVTLNKSDIADIIDAANINPLKKDGRCAEPEPWSLQRLQVAYSWEERRAIHDAVVSAAPACHALTDLALPSGDGAEPAPKPRSRLEVLAELRDMKRRRTKYRVAPKTCNYSDLLRGVISTQMEHFSDIHKETNSHKYSKDNPDKTKEANFKNHDEVHIKKEPIDDDNYSEECYRRKRDRSKERYKESEREKRHDDYKRRHNDERDRYPSSSKDRSRTEYRSSDKHGKEEMDYRGDNKYRKEEKVYRSSEKYRKEDHDYRSSEKYGKEDHDYRSSEKYRKEDRYYRGDYKDHSSKKSSRTSDDKYKRERDSHKSHRDEHRRYYDSKEDEFEASRKRIKQEKD